MKCCHFVVYSAKFLRNCTQNQAFGYERKRSLKLTSSGIERLWRPERALCFERVFAQKEVREVEGRQKRRTLQGRALKREEGWLHF